MLGMRASFRTASWASRMSSICTVNNEALFKLSTKFSLMAPAPQLLKRNCRNCRISLKAIITCSIDWCIHNPSQIMENCLKWTDLKLIVVDANRCRPGILILWQQLSSKHIKLFIEPRVSNTASSNRWTISHIRVSMLGLVSNKHTIVALGMSPILWFPFKCKRLKCGKPPKLFTISHFVPLTAELSSRKSCILKHRCCNIGKNPLINLHCVRMHTSLNLAGSYHPSKGCISVS